VKPKPHPIMAAVLTLVELPILMPAIVCAIVAAIVEWTFEQFDRLRAPAARSAPGAAGR
jgi:hypothetical protein